MTELRALLGRNPGATEASVRSELRRSIGDAMALDRAIASGDVVRRGAKLYLREDAPRVPAAIGEHTAAQPIVRGADERHDSPAFNSFAELAIDILKGVK